MRRFGLRALRDSGKAGMLIDQGKIVAVGKDLKYLRIDDRRFRRTACTPGIIDAR